MQKKPDVDLTHMPQYIKQAPWYVDQGKDQPVLTHQRARNDPTKTSIDKWYKRGVKTDQQVTKYRKGACTNCGAITHNAKTCTERPRRIGAKFAQKDFANDEIIDQIQLDYEGKRDRWNGYDQNTYKFVIDEWNSLNDEQKKKRTKELEEKLQTQAQGEQEAAAAVDENDSDSSENSDPDKEKGAEDQKGFANKDPRVRTTIRNLRIREDTAKYLRNLDPLSAVYDGKSRIMKDNPNPDLPESMQQFKGDNFAKFSGDYMKLMNQEGFMLEANFVGGVEVNNVAMPSQVEILQKQFKEKKELLKNKKMQELLGKYGGGQHLEIPDEMKEAILGTEDAVGQSGQSQLVNSGYYEVKQFDNRGLLGIRSKYEEDIHQNGHTGVWGSYWHSHFGWGYRCCFSFDKNSKCRGEEGKVESIKKEYEYELTLKKASEEEQKRYVEEQNKKYIKTTAETPAESKEKQIIEEKSKVQANKKIDDVLSSDSEEEESSSSSSSDSDSGSDSKSYHSDSSGPRNRRRKREKKRHSKEKAKASHKGESSNKPDQEKHEAKKEDYQNDRKRKYNSLQADKPLDQEEIEEYQRKKDQFDDPMRHYNKNK